MKFRHLYDLNIWSSRTIDGVSDTEMPNSSWSRMIRCGPANAPRQNCRNRAFLHRPARRRSWLPWSARLHRAITAIASNRRACASSFLASQAANLAGCIVTPHRNSLARGNPLGYKKTSIGGAGFGPSGSTSDQAQQSSDADFQDVLWLRRPSC
jgi:hypothetical protein